MRGIYLNMGRVSSEQWNKYLSLLKRTTINSLVVDVKNEQGYLLFPSLASRQKKIFAPVKFADYEKVRSLIRRAKKQNIYLIARVVVFKDAWTIKKNRSMAIFDKFGRALVSKSGSSVWVNPYETEYWKYIGGLLSEIADMGFHEIQLDYVRFPESKTSFYDKVSHHISKNQIIQLLLHICKN